MRLRLWFGLTLLPALAVAGAVALVVQPGVSPRPSQPPAVDAQRLRADVVRLAETFYPRSYDQPEQLQRAARYLHDELAAAGARTSYQQVRVQGQVYHNVLARFGPERGPLRVVGAHYDSHAEPALAGDDPRGYSPRSHTPGADDNASGVAGLLELARLLGRQPPSRPVELVAYTLEEPPHFRGPDMGSAWHARSLREAGREVEFMLSLEMIGRFSDRPGSQRYPLRGMQRLYSERGDFIAVVGRLGDFGLSRRVKAAMAGATDLPVHSINAPPRMQGIDFSDHLSYWREDYPALMITDTAFMRSDTYHQPSDTADKLDYARMAKVVQGVYAVLQQD